MDPTPTPELVTATAVLEDARALRVAADRAEALILLRACEWADWHPVLPPDKDGGPAFEDDQLPGVNWDATAGFALAVGLSDTAGTALIHEAQELRHRLPGVWTAMLAGRLPAWRARRIAQKSIGQPADVAAHLDRALAGIAHKVGPITLARLLDEAMLRLHPEERELDQLEALDHRHARLHDQISHDGVATMEICADLKDLLDFDATLSELAAALAGDGCTDSLDVRRAQAVGILADPAAALDLLAPGTGEDADRTGSTRKPRKRLVLYVHLSQAAVAGLEPVGRCEAGNQPLLEQQIRDWCGRSDTQLTVQPVIDLADHVAATGYEIPDRLAAHTALRDHACAFPYCTLPARRCDHDHTIPHAAGGATCTCNIAPLCRRHHRLKTLAGWTYAVIEPGSYLWTTPWGYAYHRDQTGTVDVTPPRSRSRGTGCRHHDRPPDPVPADPVPADPVPAQVRLAAAPGPP